MIQHIIFDIGNVLTDFCWQDFLAEFSFSKEEMDRIAKATVLDKEWDELDRGVKPVSDIIDKFVENDKEMEVQIRKAFVNISGILRKRDYAIPWIQELKEKGYGVFYLSNFFEKATNDCFHAIDFIPYMDGGIFSYQEKLIKPDPAIYQLLLERYQLKAEHCLFLDDKIENCVAARNEGIASIVFTQRQDVLEEMKRYGIE